MCNGDTEEGVPDGNVERVRLVNREYVMKGEENFRSTHEANQICCSAANRMKHTQP